MHRPSAPITSHNPSPGHNPPRVQRSVRRKLVMVTILLVVLPTAVYALWTERLVRQSMLAHLERNVLLLGQTVAGSLSNGVFDDPDRVREVIDPVAQNPRLAFVIVKDHRGRIIDSRAQDPKALAEYEKGNWMPSNLSHGRLGRSLFGGNPSKPILCQVPIWNPPLDSLFPAARPSTGEDRTLEGYVVLAMYEPGLDQMIETLQINQMLAAGLICLLSVVVVMWAANRWVQPLRSLIKATVQLSKGQTPTPIAWESPDELGVLAAHFNHMAQSLSTVQRQLQSANQELERKVLLRTTELQTLNHRLQMEMKNRNEFLRAVTHDLGTPLRNINGMASMLLRKYKDEINEDVVQKLQRINANVKIQNDLINDLLDLSRLRTRSSKRQVVDIQQLVGDLRNSMAYDLEHSHITFEVADPLPTIVAERNRIRQVFQNLLDNAVKYMGDGEPRRITLSHRSRDGKHLFCITDTGMGIEAEDQPHVFDVFRRGWRHQNPDSPLTPSGRGVGLASVKTIVELYGGDIWVESEPGQGSTFHFTFDEQLVSDPLAAA